MIQGGTTARGFLWLYQESVFYFPAGPVLALKPLFGGSWKLTPFSCLAVLLLLTAVHAEEGPAEPHDKAARRTQAPCGRDQGLWGRCDPECGPGLRNGAMFCLALSVRGWGTELLEMDSFEYRSSPQPQALTSISSLLGCPISLGVSEPGVLPWLPQGGPWSSWGKAGSEWVW